MKAIPIDLLTQKVLKLLLRSHCMIESRSFPQQSQHSVKSFPNPAQIGVELPEDANN